MTDQPYTDDDLRDEAVRQHNILTMDPDYVGIGEMMQGDEPWDSLSGDDFDTAQRKIDDLLSAAADISDWAIDIGALRLEPASQTLSVDGDGKPLARIHVTFAKELDAKAPAAFLVGLAQALADGI